MRIKQERLCPTVAKLKNQTKNRKEKKKRFNSIRTFSKQQGPKGPQKFSSIKSLRIQYHLHYLIQQENKIYPLIVSDGVCDGVCDIYVI